MSSLRSIAKTLGVLCAAALVPSAAISIFWPGFGLLFAPFVFLFALLTALVLWFLLKWLRCPAWARYLLIFGGVLYLAVNQGQSGYHFNTPEGKFERLLLKPIPPSVRFLSSDGTIGMAGGEECLTFSISPNDLQSIIQAKGLKPHMPQGASWENFDQRPIAQSKSHGVEPAFIYRSGEQFDFVMLLVNEARDTVFLYRSRI